MTPRIGNWKKWGADDERGTLNYITPEKVARAATLVRTGRVFPLAIPLKAKAPIWPGRHANWHVGTFHNLDGPEFGAAEDLLMMHTHGSTHIDALAHFFTDGLLYNGFPAKEAIDATGTKRNAITNIGAIVTRGLFLDIAADLQLQHLPPDHVISVDEIQSAAQARGLNVESGDALIIRTGWLQVWKDDAARFDAAQPGIGKAVAEWAGERGIALIGSDNSSVESYPAGFPEVHIEFIRNQGGYLVELLNLETLAAENIHEFMFILAPLNITRGLGSPVTPLAVC